MEHLTFPSRHDLEIMEPVENEEIFKSILFQIINRYANMSSEDGSGRKMIVREGKDYSAISEESDDLAEELTIIREILVRQEHVYNEEVKEYERKIEALESDLQQTEMRARQLKEQNIGENRREQEIAYRQIIEEYDKTVTQLVAAGAAEEAARAHELQQLTDECNRYNEALADVEKQFTELHMLYENQKQQKQQMEATKVELENKIEVQLAQLQRKTNAYKTLEEHAKTQIERARHDLNAKRQFQLTECARLKGVAKKLELKIESLEGMIEQKTKENKELTSIYDECLSKLVPSSEP